jgi:hypothetical protein
VRGYDHWLGWRVGCSLGEAISGREGKREVEAARTERGAEKETAESVAPQKLELTPFLGREITQASLGCLTGRIICCRELGRPRLVAFLA